MANESIQGKIAEELRGVDGVEIKATIPDRQIEAALALYGLTAGDEDPRFIYFFDTPDLDLFEAGVIGRARRVVGGDHDSTIKFRPVKPETVPPLWSKLKGFKIEADASETQTAISASLTMKVEKGLIKRVAAGEVPFASLFNEEQLKFVLAMAQRQFDYARVVPLGPVRAWKWKFTDPGLPWDLTVELWRRDDGERLLEASIKVSVPQAAVAIAAFGAFLRDRGAQTDECQQAKTRWALEYHAAKAANGVPAVPSQETASS